MMKITLKGKRKKGTMKTKRKRRAKRTRKKTNQRNQKNRFKLMGMKSTTRKRYKLNFRNS